MADSNAWKQPVSSAPALKLYNSLTKKNEIFVPQQGNNVRWYSCGPTVYDASHMGHARSYISFDILRRVMQDYFGYQVEYVMNITDLDDKIIVKARRRYLFSKYAAALPDSAVAFADAQEAREMLFLQSQNDPDADKRTMHGLTLASVDEALKQYAQSSKDEAAVNALVAGVKDPLSVLLDKRLGQTVDDHAIFTQLTQQYEREFHDDMRALNVRVPDVLTRVTEYIPQIVTFVEKIIDNKFAYASNGSVYFDTVAFSANPNHKYAKLMPEAVGDLASLAEGEGELSSAGGQEKRNGSDFALWKASKPGEPAWDSPWGKGRPGWHIECSVMASDVIGQVMDIHTGGVDLKFPHHDNEIAQSEAHYGHQQWVNYFLHSGHLKIKGLKMSKSLKNFITIRAALADYSARQLRFAFLMHQWNATLDYSPEVMQQAVQKEKFFNEFFLNVKALARNASGEFIAMTPAERALLDAFRAAKTSVHAALCDNIDTARVLQILQDLVGISNLYVRDGERSGVLDTQLLRNIAVYMTNLFRIFGLIDECGGSIGFPLGAQAQAAEDAIMPELTEFAALRDTVRRTALKLKDYAMLAECDRIRDEVLPEHGVRLEDKDKRPALVKLVDKDELLKEKQREKDEKEEKARQKAEAALKKAEAEAAKLAQSKINPADLFRGRAEYSQFDESGLPTHNADGTEVSKSARKKLEKEQSAQDKLYKQYLQSQAGSGASQ